MYAEFEVVFYSFGYVIPKGKIGKANFYVQFEMNRYLYTYLSFLLCH